jgi:Zn-dependent protease with chaperone function
VNFFDRQRAARGTSTKLVVLYLIAVVAIVVVIDLVVWLVLNNQPRSTLVGWLIAAAVLSVLLIGGGTLTKSLQLRAGGAAVAQSLGAVPVDPTTSDPQLRRFANIVEEMSLASGVPMPRLFVLETEPGINAFAAGYNPADAAITVTAGALQNLNRDELQGVIGHEFSHILNGDMRLNIKLIGLLNGILLLSLIGSRILFWGSFGGNNRRNNRDNSINVLLFVALAMTILGFVGQFFASIIKAAVSRQREWLADASSVQFTRNPDGLAGALKKIATLDVGSQLRNKVTATQASHMLFGEGGRSFGSLFATHPPLLERIRALEPDFDPSALDDYAASAGEGSAATGASTAGFAPAPTHTTSSPSRPVAGPQVAASVGTVTPAHGDRSQELSRQIPDHVRQLSAQPSTAIPLVIAMLLPEDVNTRTQQLDLVSGQLGAEVARYAGELATAVADLAPELRLPVLSLAFPTITARPQSELHALESTLDALAKADGTISLFEYCLTRLVASHVTDVLSPAQRSRPGSAPGQKAQQSASVLLAALAAAGNNSGELQQRAYANGMAALTGHVITGANLHDVTRSLTANWQLLDAVWPDLDALDPRAKQKLVEAMVVAVKDDGVLSLYEAELLRTACGLLHCPLPAFIA